MGLYPNFELLKSLYSELTKMPDGHFCAKFMYLEKNLFRQSQFKQPANARLLTVHQNARPVYPAC